MTLSLLVDRIQLLTLGCWALLQEVFTGLFLWTPCHIFFIEYLSLIGCTLEVFFLIRCTKLHKNIRFDDFALHLFNDSGLELYSVTLRRLCHLSLWRTVQFFHCWLYSGPYWRSYLGLNTWRVEVWLLQHAVLFQWQFSRQVSDFSSPYYITLHSSCYAFKAWTTSLFQSLYSSG